MVVFLVAMVVIDDDTSRYADVDEGTVNALAAAALVAWISSASHTFGRGLLALLIGLCLGGPWPHILVRIYVVPIRLGPQPCAKEATLP
jgi:hypothetical protein